MKKQILLLLLLTTIFCMHFWVRANQLPIKETLVQTRGKLPKDIKNIPFGTLFTDHMFVMEWTKDKQWHNARIQPYQAFSLDPASMHMHYGMEIFEGMKAYSTNNGQITLFRPLENFKRMNTSAQRMCMPEIDSEFVLTALKKLIKHDRHWVPKQKGHSLYIRPTMIATQNSIQLAPSNHYTFFIIMSPVGSLYKTGFKPISIMATKKYTRASVGGVGAIKTGGNYGASMLAQHEAHEAGCGQVLWLDPAEHRYVEEVGSMNIFFVINGTLVTPELNGTILPGITRKSVLELAHALGVKATERRVSLDEIISCIENKTCTEIFGTGTAAVICPIGCIQSEGKTYTVNNNQTGAITKKIFDLLTGIHYGTQKDARNWLELVL